MLLKYKPEDFIVREKANFTLTERGLYSYWLLRKSNMTTLAAIYCLTRHLHIPEKSIGFSGTKDKVAMTEQFISVKETEQENNYGKEIGFSNPHCTVTFVGYGDKPLLLGDLQGNSFVITVRDIDSEQLQSFETRIQGKNTYQFTNFFGEQRFSHKNVVVGKLILKRKYKEAVDEIITAQGDYEHRVREYRELHQNDHVGALKTIPRLVLLFFMHAYQSALWNEYVVLIDQETVQLIGFGTELNAQEYSVIMPIMEREQITFRDFVNNSFPELSVEGSRRYKMCTATSLSYDVTEDDIFPGKKKVVIAFFLPKGCYATTLCKALFS